MAKVELPVNAYRQQIVEAVNANQVTILTAETGAGKSTQVPQFLVGEGYRVLVTEPRRVAARTLAQRVAQERGEELGGVVGYRTAHEAKDSKRTRLLFATDGLALVRELMGRGDHDVLILDEVHEWNTNMDVLIAWSKRRQEREEAFRVVIMSATLQAHKLSRYYGGAPVIEVPGRLFPVVEEEAERSLTDDVRRLLRDQRNVLVFLPGKGEIKGMQKELEEANVKARVLPLHGELSAEEQDRCFRRYGVPKCVLATNVAQTSITIDDVDAVVDSGLERRIEVMEGIEGLYLRPISWADREQRKGRAGRTREGIYIDHCDAKEREDVPVAEILRTRLDMTVLRLAQIGLDMEDLDFFHQPDRYAIAHAKHTLCALGCLDDDGRITKVGREVARMGVSAQSGRMLVEARRLGCMEDVAVVASILEEGGIVLHKDEDGEDITRRWRERTDREEGSDLIAQLRVYRSIRGKLNKAERLVECGVHPKAFYRVRERVQLLREHLTKQKVRSDDREHDDEAIRKAVVSGLADRIYWSERPTRKDFKDEDGRPRKLGQHSVIKRATWLVGQPFDLEVKTKDGSGTLRLITLATKVEPKWLLEVAPQRRDWVLSRVNEDLWTDWTDRPSIPPPEVNRLDSTFPSIRKTQYGTCRLLEEPLLAYGALEPHPSGDDRFEAVWFRTREEAHGAWRRGQQHFEALRVKLVEGVLRREIEALEGVFKEYKFRPGYRLLDEELTRDIRIGLRLRPWHGPPGMRNWIRRAKDLKQRLERAWPEVERRWSSMEAHERSKKQAKRAREDALLELVERDPVKVRRLRACAAWVEERVGIDVARARLKEQFVATYGWKRKKQGVYEAFPGLETLPEAQDFAELRGDERVKNWIKALGRGLKQRE